ncbi:MAG: hypothetical protein IJX63_13100 [Lachnospiraceae bacterium]|nr:hypothetical protein [Lachnospiraceae bacterium]
MKKEYVSPEVEVFQFEVADRVMDIKCPGYDPFKCTSDTSGSSCSYYDLKSSMV